MVVVRWAISELEDGKLTGYALDVRSFPLRWVDLSESPWATFPSSQGATAYAEEHGVLLGSQAKIVPYKWRKKPQ